MGYRHCRRRPYRYATASAPNQVSFLKRYSHMVLLQDSHSVTHRAPTAAPRRVSQRTSMAGRPRCTGAPGHGGHSVHVALEHRTLPQAERGRGQVGATARCLQATEAPLRHAGSHHCTTPPETSTCDPHLHSSTSDSRNPGTRRSRGPDTVSTLAPLRKSSHTLFHTQ